MFQDIHGGQSLILHLVNCERLTFYCHDGYGLYSGMGDRFLSPVVMVGLVSGCFLLLVFIHERRHLNDSASEDLKTKDEED